jgi:predicted nucleic acid-binding protein
MTWLVEGIDAVAACRDPQDDKFLALALSGGAQAIVSSDDDLLSMGQFRGVRILTPREFLDQCSWLR